MLPANSKSSPSLTPCIPTLTPSENNIYFELARHLSGPTLESSLLAAIQTLSEYFGNADLLLGILHPDQFVFDRQAIYKQSTKTFDLARQKIGLTEDDIQFFSEEQLKLRPRKNKALYQSISAVSNKKNIALNRTMRIVTCGISRSDGVDAQGLIAISGDEQFNKSNEELLMESWELLSSSLTRYEYEKKLLQEAETQNNIINISQSIYTTWNGLTGWRYHNVNGLANIGFNKEDIDIRWIQKHNPLHPDDWKASISLYNNIVNKCEEYRHHYRAVGPTGKTHWYFSECTVAQENGRGGAMQTTAISRDVTKLKLAEIAAVEALQREKWIVKQTHEIFNCADNQSLSECLKPLGEYLGITRCVVRVVDAETKHCNLVAEWFHPDEESIAESFPELTSQMSIRLIERLAKTGEPYTVNHFEKEVTNKKTLNYHKAINASSSLAQPIVADGELIGYLAVLDKNPHYWSETETHIIQVIADTIHMTITRNRLVENLREAQARTQLAMQDATYSLWDHDLLNNNLFLSSEFYSTLNYHEELKITQPNQLLKLIHPKDRIKAIRTYSKQIQSGNGEISIELRIKRKNNSYSWILMRGKVVERDKNGIPTQVMGINMEINQQKETLEELHVARERAEEANQSKSEFLERMSHEIRTPMNAILGMSYLMLDTELQKEQKNHLEDVEAAAKSLLHVIDDILDFSKIESGELAIVKEKFNIYTMITRLLKLFTVRAEQSGNQLKFNITDEIPQFVIGDPHRVGQIITNLLSNALKFTQDGTVSISVQIAELNEQNNNISLLFSVSDSGIGLNEKQLKNLFTPFTQAEGSTTRKYGGTGLGLSICKHLVEMMGGSIHAISLPNVGTTFHFTIVFDRYQQAEKSDALDSQSIKKPENSIDPEIFIGKKVLLTEDNIVNQRVANGILKKYQIDVITANNGQEALYILSASEGNEFDAILMDIEMPVLDGLETAKAIRKMPKFSQIPIIAMTAHAMVGDKERCLQAGMNDHIPKPINPKLLLKSLTTCWSRTHATETTPLTSTPTRRQV